MTNHRHLEPAATFWILATITLAAAQGLAQAPATDVAKNWADRATEIEAYLKSAEIIGMEELKVGVTRPRRAKLAPGGPVDAMAWKAINLAERTATGKATSPRLPPTSSTSCLASA